MLYIICHVLVQSEYLIVSRAVGFFHVYGWLWVSVGLHVLGNYPRQSNQVCRGLQKIVFVISDIQRRLTPSCGIFYKLFAVRWVKYVVPRRILTKVSR